MSTTADYREKRKSIRYPLNIGFTLTIDTAEFVGVTGNISLGGAYLQDIAPEMPATLMTETGFINLIIPKTPITLDCKIVYVNSGSTVFPSGAGIQFSTMDQVSLSIIERYMANHS